MIYVRGAGSHIAERVMPAPGSARERQLAALAADPDTDWFIEGEQPEQPAATAPDAEAASAPSEDKPKPATRARRKGGDA